MNSSFLPRGRKRGWKGVVAFPLQLISRLWKTLMDTSSEASDGQWDPSACSGLGDAAPSMC